MGFGQSRVSSWVSLNLLLVRLFLTVAVQYFFGNSSLIIQTVVGALSGLLVSRCCFCRAHVFHARRWSLDESYQVRGSTLLSVRVRFLAIV